MDVVNTVLPILLILVLGAGLARGGFLGTPLIGELNRLVFWVGIPALVIHALALAEAPAARSLPITGALALATVAGAAGGFVLALALGLPRWRVGTFIQAVFRGNLAFVGLPVLHYAAGERSAEAIALAVMVLAPIVLLNNSLSVLALLASTHRVDRAGLKLLGREIATNPLVLSCLLGLLLAAAPVSLPTALLRALETIGQISIPLALIAIGATLATTTLQGSVGPAIAAALGKVVFLPALAFLAGRWLGLEGFDQRLLLIFAACPVAASSYIMAVKMGGDGALASTALVLSTVLSALSLSLVLFLGP